jgi:hypothetical protein
MGLGFESISEYDAPHLFQTLISEGVLTSQVFGTKFAASGSELFIGGTNSALYTGSFTYLPLTIEVCISPKALIYCNCRYALFVRLTGKRLSRASL